MAKESFDHASIEKEAREKWVALGLYEADLQNGSKKSGEPYYLLTEFPYPSGDLHTGHWYAFALPDILARYLRMQGKNVLYPIGFDAFGLPAENAAIKYGKSPAEWTEGNMARMREQLKTMGASFDWSREVVTCSPEYYKWTQWLFAKLFEQKLAYRAEASVKWCPNDQTVLANEQVIDGHCDRCGTEVIEKRLTQWFLKITDYAERLLADLEPLPWREDIKEAQRAWIGKSEGARLSFKLSHDESVDVFTTRPDTIFGVTYLVLAPEHPIVARLLDEGTIANEDAVRGYQRETAQKTERERSEAREKTGVQLAGVTAKNPANGEEIPVYVADYVLGSYGTGAVMAVPAHDERDFTFAQKHGLPIRDVVMPVLPDPTNPHQPGKEVVFRKATINILYDPKTDRYLTLRWKQQPWTTYVTGGVEDGEDPVEAAIREIAEETGYTDVTLVRKLGGDAQAEFYAAHKGVNRVAQNSLFLFELQSDAQQEVAEEEAAQHEAVWINAADLPTTKFQHSESQLIKDRIASGMDAYTGSGLLIDSGEFSGRDSEEAKWEIVEAVGGTRETQYRLRDWLVSRQRYWGCPIPIVYDPEGKPHAVPAEHLPWLLPTDVDFTPTGSASPLASSQELRERVERIFGKGWTPEFDTLDTFVDSSWYFTRYLAPHEESRFSEMALMKKWLPVDRYSGGSEHTTMHLLYSRFFYKALYDLSLVPTPEPFNERFNRGLILGPDGQKMSKSKGNVINPDEYVEKYGSDAVRLYLAFIGPYNEPGHYPWKPEGVASMRKFLDRIWAIREKVTDADESIEVERPLAKAATKIGTDIERLKLNTAVSALMVLMNSLEKERTITRTSFRKFLATIAPLAPHLAERMFADAFAADAKGRSVHQEPWPAFDAALLVEDTVTIAVQVAGKKRGELEIPPDASEEEAVEAALKLPKVAEALVTKRPARIIYVPGRILNLIP